MNVSIPRSEFWSFGPWRHHSNHSERRVSIPRSEFWSFGRAIYRVALRFFASFNSSVGILVVRTCRASLGTLADELVSILRSEFWSFGPSCSWAGMKTSSARFNSSVGILVVRTPPARGGTQKHKEFQFLGRNSGRSDEQRASRVSVRRAGFNSSVGILVVRT